MAMGKVETRVRQLIDQGVDYTKYTEAKAAYQKQFGAQVNHADVLRYGQRYMKDLGGVLPTPTKVKVEEEPEPEETENDNVALPKLAKEEKDSPYVPNRLLNSISAINVAIREVGGPEKALALAQAIETAGGIKNFTRAVQLLQAIQETESTPTPTRPQVANIDLMKNSG